MTTTKTIKITGQEILEYYVSVAEDCTIAEARDILKNANAVYHITKEKLEQIEISYEK